MFLFISFAVQIFLFILLITSITFSFTCLFQLSIYLFAFSTSCSPLCIYFQLYHSCHIFPQFLILFLRVLSPLSLLEILPLVSIFLYLFLITYFVNSFSTFLSLPKLFKSWHSPHGFSPYNMLVSSDPAIVTWRSNLISFKYF
jgi:hypothetical protein